MRRFSHVLTMLFGLALPAIGLSAGLCPCGEDCPCDPCPCHTDS